MDILHAVGIILTYIVVFVGLPILIFQSLKEFTMITKFDSAILRNLIVFAVVSAYVLIMAVFFLFNLKIFD